MADTVIKKQCTKCHHRKPLSDFYDKKKGRLGKDSYCIDCRKKESAKSYVKLRTRRKKRTKKVILKTGGCEASLSRVQRKIVARKLCHYRKINKVLKEHEIDINYFSTVDKKQIAHNEKIDEILNIHGLGDIHHVKPITL